MKKSSRGSAGTWILVIVVILVIIGIYFYATSNTSAPTPTTSTTATTTSAVATYTNSEYGFTFEYPSDWNLTESADKTIVTVDSGIIAQGLPALTLTFTIVDNDAFQAVQTKVGNISYDRSQNALVDTNETPERCLPYDDLRGLAGGVGTLPTFNYGGSTMSDPVYWENAILTNESYLLDVGESYERPTDDATNQILVNGEQEIYSTLALTNGVEARVPACASATPSQ